MVGATGQVLRGKICPRHPSKGSVLYVKSIKILFQNGGNSEVGFRCRGITSNPWVENEKVKNIIHCIPEWHHIQGPSGNNRSKTVIINMIGSKEHYPTYCPGLVQRLRYPWPKKEKLWSLGIVLSVPH